MINVILLIFTVGVFWGGFRCGNKFATVKELCVYCIDKAKEIM